MAITIITKNSTTASKRPTAAQLVTGELGLNIESTDPGLYFEDSAGNIRKVGGAHYGAAAPNVAAAGQAGNSVGELWYNTADLKLYIWDGVAWVVAGGTDTQSFYEAGPWAYGTNRPDGTPLLPGDEWYDSSTTPATSYVWDGAAWIVGANDTHSFTGAGDPVTLAVAIRPDGSALQNGDVYVDTTVGQERAYRYDLATTSWTNIDNKTFTQDTTPPVASSFDGDQWYDTTTLESFVYYDDGTSKQWVQMIAPTGVTDTDTHSIYSASAPAVRPNGTPLLTGDLWIDFALNREFVYNGATWDPVGPYSFTQDTTPAAAYDGDLWYDTTTLESFVYYDDGTSSQWVQMIAPTGGVTDTDTHSIYSAGAPAARPNGTPLLTGDLWIDSTLNREFVYNGATWDPVGSYSFTQDTTPAAAYDGDFWYDTTTLETFVYYNDGTSSQWVQLF